MTTKIPGAGSNMVAVDAKQAIKTPKYPVAAYRSICFLKTKAHTITAITTNRLHML